MHFKNWNRIPFYSSAGKV